MRGQGDLSQNLQQVFPLVLHAQCPMPNAQCPMPNALFPIPQYLHSKVQD
jgi:hypothetical protein